MPSYDIMSKEPAVSRLSELTAVPTRRRLLLALVHTIAVLLAALHFARFLAPILAQWFMVVTAIVTVICALGMEARRLRFLPATLLFAAVVAALRGPAELLVQAWRTLGSAMDADALALFLDTGLVASLPVIAVLWISTFFLTRYPVAYRGHPAGMAVVLLVLFWTQGRYNLTLYDHPLSYAVLVALFLLLELLILIIAFRATSSFASVGRRSLLRGLASFAFIVLPFVLLVASGLYSRYAEGSTARGGGLLEPSLFRFDFSDYLRLESEISLSDDLVLFVKKPPRQSRSYLRRYVLSGYDPRRGFHQTKDEQVPEEVGNAAQRYPDPGYSARERVEQELYLVNFDPSSLVAMNYPVEVVPYRSWENASFARVYSATSRVSRAQPSDLTAVAEPRTDTPAVYTDYGGDDAIASLAREIAEGIRNPYRKVAAIEEHLRDEYYYSLSPGVAADGDQLMHFLFESQKGYCSYFAFSMALMVRSLDIPARVAVGFFVDPRLQVLDFNVIRADMAHAWVEVYFNEYGWIEFDPTSQRLAPGEDVEFGSEVQVDEISSLLQEILENRDRLRPLDAEQASGDRGETGAQRLSAIGGFARRWWWAFAILFAAALIGARHAFLRGMDRPLRSASAVAVRYRRLLRVAGYLGWPQRREESVLEHALRVEREAQVPMSEAAGYYLAALFARPGRPEDPGSFAARENDVRRGLWRRARPAARFRFVFLPFGTLSGRRGGEKRRRGGSRKRSRTGTFMLVLMLSLCALGSTALAPPELAAQETRPSSRDVWTAGDYLSAVEEAIRSERYDRAVSLIEEGTERFPEHAPLYLAAGDLYRDEELYEMALHEYRRAAELEPRAYQALYGQSAALGRLNREREAIRVLQRLSSLYPENTEVLSDLGWLYFKTHQLAKGEELLRDALDRLGMNRSLAMTLATIYADMYDYDRAKRYYERAISDAVDEGRSYFASVARYNLSLLEKTFYQFDAALSSTEESLRLARRAPGLLARGELHERRLRYDDALSDYNAAFALDEDTPLAQVSLASVHQVFGKLDEALAYAQDVYGRENSAWMFNFGTDLERHGMNLHGLLADIYEGLYHRAGFEAADGPREWLSRLVRRAGYRVKAWFHRRNERVYARDVAQAYRREGSRLNAAWTFYRAYEDYPGKAASHLQRARELETAMIPESRPFYELQRGVLSADTALLQRARSELDPVWERIERAEAAREQAELHRKRGEWAAYAGAAHDLYLLNPGGLRQHGLSMPVDLELSLPGFDGPSYRRLSRSLERVGLDPVSRERAAFRLVISAESGDSDGGRLMIVALYDQERLRRSATISTSGMSRRAVREFAASVAEAVFTVSG